MIDLSQTVRYGIVSGICLTLCLVTVPLLDHFGIHYAIATFVGFCLSAVTGFLLHSRWTFGVERSFIAFSRYVLAVSLNLPLTILLIGIGHDLLGLTVTTATLLASAILVVWNYIAARWAILRPLSARKPHQSA